MLVARYKRPTSSQQQFFHERAGACLGILISHTCILNIYFSVKYLLPLPPWAYRQFVLRDGWVAGGKAAVVAQREDAAFVEEMTASPSRWSQ